MGRRVRSSTATFATVPGVWEVHDNFHVVVMAVHLLQGYAVELQRPPGAVAATFCRGAA